MFSKLKLSLFWLKRRFMIFIGAESEFFYVNGSQTLPAPLGKKQENEILMYLRKTANRKNEVSIEEPLNVDVDGNELLLSDVLGSDGDAVGRDLETRDERNQLLAVVEKLDEREKAIMTMRFGLFGSKE